MRASPVAASCIAAYHSARVAKRGSAGPGAHSEPPSTPTTAQASWGAIRKTEWTNEVQRARFADAVAAGVKIANGTDCGIFPHRGIAKNLAYYVRFGGISDAKAIQSATRWSAELMGWQDRVGGVAPGLLADLITVPGDPTTDVRLLEDVPFVVKGGTVVRMLKRSHPEALPSN